jgi:hypothetical protein
LKLISLILLISSSLLAVAPTQSEEKSIYIEGILFLVVFGTMGVISYIYSNKHAQEYKKKEPQNKEETSPYAERIAKLLEMKNDNLLSEKEFEILSDYYLN